MFKRIGNLIKGFIGLFVGGLEKRSPEALLDVEKENLRKQIAQFNQGLATHAGLVEKLISQVKKLDREENDLRSKTAAHLKAGNRQLAGDFALKLKKVDATHDEVKDQLEEAEKHYKELIRARDVSVKEARDKIQELRRGIDDMKVKKAVAELNKKAALTAEQKTARTEATKKADADGVKGKERRDLITKMMKLSDAQTEAMAELRKKQGEMRKAVMELLTDEQKGKLRKKGKKKDN